MITKETLERISNCTNITNSITIKYPITMAVSDSRDMVMRIDLSDMEEFDRPVSFFNRLSNFLCSKSYKGIVIYCIFNDI